MAKGVWPAGKAKLRPTELYIALDNLDFSWYPSEIPEVIRAWETGMHIADIASALDRSINEVFLLLLDLASKGKIKEREGGVFGNVYVHDRGTVAGAE